MIQQIHLVFCSLITAKERVLGNLRKGNSRFVCATDKQSSITCVWNIISIFHLAGWTSTRRYLLQLLLSSVPFVDVYTASGRCNLIIIPKSGQLGIRNASVDRSDPPSSTCVWRLSPFRRKKISVRPYELWKWKNRMWVTECWMNEPTTEVGGYKRIHPKESRTRKWRVRGLLCAKQLEEGD